MKIKFWKAMLNAVVIYGGFRFFSNTNEDLALNILLTIIGSFMIGAGVKWMIEDIEYED